MTTDILKDFEQHCNIVSHLLTQKISFDAQIEVKSEGNFSKEMNQCLPIYSKYFENDQSNKYQIPNYNMIICRPHHKPFCALESYKNEFGVDNDVNLRTVIS